VQLEYLQILFFLCFVICVNLASLSRPKISILPFEEAVQDQTRNPQDLAQKMQFLNSKWKIHQIEDRSDRKYGIRERGFDAKWCEDCPRSLTNSCALLCFFKIKATPKTHQPSSTPLQT